MNYELIVLDLDGTLTNSEKKITPKTLETLLRIQEKGKKAAIATGRPTPGATYIAKELQFDKFGGYVLSYNGGLITNYATSEIIYNKTIPAELIRPVYEEAIRIDAGIISYGKDEIIAGNGIDKYIRIEAGINNLPVHEVDNFPDYITFPVNKCLLTGEPEHMAEAEMILKSKFGHCLNIYRSEPFFLEVMPQNIDKAYSLSKLLTHLRLDREQMICCGDGFNDLSMIKYAGLGVAMANAQDIVKEAADFITLSNDEDGVAYTIEKFMLE